MDITHAWRKQTASVQQSMDFWLDKFLTKHSQCPDWCCGLCLLKVSEVWRLFPGNLKDELIRSLAINLNQTSLSNLINFWVFRISRQIVFLL